MPDLTTTGDLLAACLRATGATRAFRAPGHSLPAPDGIALVDVPSAEIAVLLADADGRLATAPALHPGLALLPGRRVRIGDQPGEQVIPHEVDDVESLPAAVAGWTLGEVHAAVELDILVDLEEPAPVDVQALTLATTTDQLTRLSPSLAELRLVLLIGPGVVRAGEVAGVAEAARHTGAPVVATFGAAGVLPLDDPAWRGVVGLQADDAGLAGLAGVELVVAAGVDPVEALSVIPDGAQVLDVEPWHLGLMAHHWPDSDGSGRLTGGALVEELAALASSALAATSVPLHPVRAVADLAEVLEGGALVAADPGPAGLWLARGLVERPAGSTVVPARPVHGFGVAAAMVAALDGRPAVAVVTAPTDPATEALLDLAAALDLTVVCEVWGADAAWDGASEHRERLVGALHEGGVQRLGVPVDLAATRDLVELAGPVQAWTTASAEDSFS